jgi:ubiquinone/menaquinone biosynthesis C-methylase UbiE
MIAIAKKKYAAPNVHFETADVTKLPYKNNSFDAIFDFAIIHHVPNWQDALKELHRVLKPDGELLIEDLSIETFENPFGRILRKVLAHPYKEMYRRDMFMKQLEKAGFSIIKQEQHFPLASVQFFNVIAKKR